MADTLTMEFTGKPGPGAGPNEVRLAQEYLHGDAVVRTASFDGTREEVAAEIIKAFTSIANNRKGEADMEQTSDHTVETSKAAIRRRRKTRRAAWSATARFLYRWVFRWVFP